MRLAYCLNLHPAEDLESMLAGIAAVTLPLRDRLAEADEPFGAGLYLPAGLARILASPEGACDLDRLAAFLERHALDPFTYNAFPAGGFGSPGLKARVFRPTWMEEGRLRFTLDVAAVAARLARGTGGLQRSHVSVSTHTGAIAAEVRGEEDVRACRENLARAAAGLASIEERDGVRIILSLEAEPRALCGDNASLARFLAGDRSRHLGACLDACHSAVEFEEPTEAFELAAACGSIGKLQFSSALSLRDPARSPEGRAQLLALDEPRYLHQVTGLAPRRRCQATDLPELARELAGPAREDWLACPEWRCHFHVPVDLAAVGDRGLSTTREHADRVLDAALARPDSWGVEELHLEIETYTWDVLPGPARGTGAEIDGLEREYRHVIGRLEAAGWERARGGLR